MSCRSRAFLAAVLISALSLQTSPTVRGQSTPPASQPAPQSAPTFRTGVRLIDLDVFVTDKDGKFVGDLTQDDFEIIEDGTPQEIRSFSFVNLPLPVAANTTPAVETAPEPDVRTNTTPQDRVYVIVLDSPSTYSPPSRDFIGGLTYTVLMKRVVGQFVRESLGPRDQVAVVHTQGTFSDSQPFTTSKEVLLASIDRYGRGLAGDNNSLTAQEQVARHLGSFKTLQDVAERLGAISGRRKAILWVGAQLIFAAPECGPKPSPECAILRASYPNLATAYRDAITVATRNNVVIYSVDPSGLVTDAGTAEMDRRAGLQAVAEDTGGLSVIGTNNFTGGFQSIVRDNSTYYILGYSPSTDHRDGKFHDVRVRVKKPGYTVRARKGYFAPSATDNGTPLPPLPDGVSEAARNALRLPLSVSGLGLELFTTPLKGTGPDASVVVGGRISGDLMLAPRSQIALSYQVFTKENQVQTGAYKVFTLDLSEKNRERVAEDGLAFADRITLPAGRYELRYVVDQPDANVGSVVVPLVVPTFDEPLALSGVVLGALSTTGQVVLREDPELQSMLGAAPTSIRRFPVGDLLAALTEVYSDDPQTTGDDITVSAAIVAAGGKPVLREGADLVETGNARPGRWRFKVEMNLGDLVPGDYVLTLEATSSRRPDQPVRRQIPIAVYD